MPLRFWIRIVEVIFVAVLGVALLVAWRDDRHDRAQLTAELTATKQLVAAAGAQQRDREAQLVQTLAVLAAQKRTVLTPTQIVRDLPREMGLPSPIVLQSGPVSSIDTPEPATNGRSNSQPSSKANAGRTSAVIPAEDLKPLYDFTIDCKACQAKLTAAQGDLTDERAKTAALTRDRDSLMRVAKGGSAWRRLGHAAKWLLIGAAAGAAAVKVAH